MKVKGVSIHYLVVAVTAVSRRLFYDSWFGIAQNDEVTITTIRFSIRNQSTAAIQTVGLGKSAFCDLVPRLCNGTKLLSHVVIAGRPGPRLPSWKALGADRNPIPLTW